MAPIRRQLLAALLAALLLSPVVGLAGIAGSGKDAGGAALRALLPDAGVPDIDTFMQIGGHFSPSMSQDGRRLFYFSAASGTSQLYRLDQGGFPTQITFLPGPITYMVENEDLSYALSGFASPGSENDQIHLIDLTTGRVQALTNDPSVRHASPRWSADGLSVYYCANQIERTSFSLFVHDFRSGENRLVLERSGTNSVCDLSGDDRRLLFYTSTGSNNNDLYLLDLASKAVRHLTPHEGAVQYSAPFFSADSRGLYMISTAGAGGVSRFMYLDLESLTLRAVGDPTSPWDVETYGASASRRYLTWVENQNGYSRILLLDTESGKLLPTPELAGIVSTAQPTDEGLLCFSYNSPTLPPDAWVWDFRAAQQGRLDTAGPRQLTFAPWAGIDPTIFRAPELIRYASSDGFEIPAWLYLPSDFTVGRPVPFIVDVHGGPEGQSRPDFNRHYGYLLQHGFGILAPNFRGSTGYGQRFLDADNYKGRQGAIEDVANGARWLLERGYAAPGRMGVKGMSYGGFMTMAVMAEYPDLFQVGVEQAGIANFVSFLEQTADYRRALRENEYGPLSDRAFLESISPLTRATRIRGPLMVVHGVKDQRVPIGEARQILRAVAQNGVPLDSLIFADEGHSIAKRENRLTYFRRMVAFFKQHLQPLSETR
ncbi:MAG: S9 family peptidase [Candidatus Eisenbacteria bacterium]|nr:S9 family peptidase [Candidatus Eisenbacteria bacterium]